MKINKFSCVLSVKGCLKWKVSFNFLQGFLLKLLKDYVMYCICMFEEWACVALELLDTVKKYGNIKLSWMAYSGQQRHRGLTLNLLLFWQGQIHADKDFSRRFQTELKRFDLEG